MERRVRVRRDSPATIVGFFYCLCYKNQYGLYYPTGRPVKVSFNHTVLGYYSINESGVPIQLKSYEPAIFASTLNSGGSGYSVGDYGTINGGVVSATYQVTAVSGGAVTAYSISNTGGGYNPMNNVATTATSGSGSGFTINITSISNNNVTMLRPDSILNGLTLPNSHVCIAVSDTQTTDTLYLDIVNYYQTNVVPTPYVTSCATVVPKATSVGLSTATISWAAIQGANGYEYVNSTSNTAPTGDGTYNSGTSLSLTGLSATTTYYCFVRTICIGGMKSTWASVSYTTT